MSHTTIPQPQERLLPLPEVLSIVGMKKSRWYEGVKAGKFPAPVKIGRSSRWPLSTINKCVQDMINESR